jgi:hypothetical protein
MDNIIAEGIIIACVELLFICYFSYLIYKQKKDDGNY